jgi:hypothetical protein
MRPRLSLLVFVTLTACSTAGNRAAEAPATIGQSPTTGEIRVGQQSAATTTVNARPAAVWEVLPQIYLDLGINPEVNDPAALTFGTRRFTQSRLGDVPTANYLRCAFQGSGVATASSYRIRLTVVSYLSDAPGGQTRMMTEVSGQASSVANSSAPVNCVSTGALEDRIQKDVAERLRH